MIRPPILPSCLDFLFPPMRTGITSLLSVLMSLSCPPSLSMSSTLIVVRVSHSHNKCTSCHLTSSLLPCLITFKSRRSSKMILQIIAPLCCQHWHCCCPKARSVCQPDGSLIFHGLLPMQSFSGEKPDINCIWQDGKLNLSLGVVREKECEFWRTAKPFPPTAKGRMFGMRQRDPSPPGE